MLLQVYKAMKCGVQPIAVKVVHGTDRRQLSAFVKVGDIPVTQDLDYATSLSTIDNLQASLQEIAMLKQLSFDKNILQYYGAFEVCGTPVLVTR